MAGLVAIAAHNVRFDRLFLQREFERIGTEIPDLFAICTMELSGGGPLDDCCERYGVAPTASPTARWATAVRPPGSWPPCWPTRREREQI